MITSKLALAAIFGAIGPVVSRDRLFRLRIEFHFGKNLALILFLIRSSAFIGIMISRD